MCDLNIKHNDCSAVPAGGEESSARVEQPSIVKDRQRAESEGVYEEESGSKGGREIRIEGGRENDRERKIKRLAVGHAGEFRVA